ncbi:CATRA system-associated protein [Pseudofrankia saprophytica]|nr:CATRA system-associated protein [Pseudofrankia saprophytica]OHV31193.1 hypothetical protein BCD49_32135 [Pseudofrankia sp. EUN1h]
MGSSPVPADNREQALLTLSLARRWRLSAEQWDEVNKTLTELWKALRAGNPAAFAEAADDLLFFGPPREVTDVDGTVVEPAPGKIQERLNTLIHTLTDPSASLAPSDSRHPDRTKP